jgi:hypothetical protein
VTYTQSADSAVFFYKKWPKARRALGHLVT